MGLPESELATWAAFGGNIGGEVQRQIAADETRRLGLRRLPEFVLRSAGPMGSDGVKLLGESIDEIDPWPDVVFVSPPSSDDGEPAYKVIRRALDESKIAITAEKGALVNHPELLHHERVGRSAACGGGTSVLDVLPIYAGRYDLNELYVGLNGTLGFMAGARRLGISAEQAGRQAVELGLAEPGSASVRDIVRAEATGDIPKKAAILYNALKLGSVLDWRKLRFSLDDRQIDQALAEGRPFLLSLYPQETDGFSAEFDPREVIGGFDVRHDNWRLVAGFWRLGQSVVRAALENTTGPDVGFAVGLGRDNAHGIYTYSGPGAGPGPTASAMLGDRQRLRSSTKEALCAVEAPRPKTKVTTVRLEDIRTGTIDEREMEDNTFYIVMNWHTGWEPIWSSGVARSSEGSLYKEMRAKEQALTAKGRSVRLTPHSVTVGDETMTIRHADDNFAAVTLWTIRDQKAYERFYGPKQLDIWWGLGQHAEAA